jgi:hypothetical protein
LRDALVDRFFSFVGGGVLYGRAAGGLSAGLLPAVSANRPVSLHEPAPILSIALTFVGIVALIAIDTWLDSRVDRSIRRFFDRKDD